MRGIRRSVSAAVGLMLGGVLVPLVAGPAGAVANPVIVVTTTADVVSGGDGLLSLREAVGLANATAGADTIQLSASGGYVLSICTPGENQENLNLSGDLDATDAAGLTVLGAGATISQTCKRSASVQADERVIESTLGPLSLSYLGLTGGRGYDDGIAIKDAGDLSLDTVTVFGNVNPSFVPGQSVGDSPAAVEALGGATTLSNTTISGTSGGAGLALRGASALPPNSASITNSTITGNIAPGASAGGIIDSRNPPGAPLQITSSIVSYNSVIGTNNVHGSAGGMILFNPAAVTDSTITGNSGFAGGGVIAGDSTTITNSDISHNHALVGGGGVTSASSTLTVVSSQLRGNDAGFGGGGFYGPGTVQKSAIVGNSARVGGGVEVENNFSALPVSLTVSDSTIAGNTARAGGGVFVDNLNGSTNATVQLTHDTVVNNSASYFGGGDAVAISATNAQPQTVGISASIIGSSTTAGPDCSLLHGAFTSGGYNFAVDGSCTPGMGAADRVAAGDSSLSGNYTGPNLSLAITSYTPAFGSPVKDLIPSADPLCTGTDQLGNLRPATSGSKCDIGSVEAEAPAYTDDGTFVALSPARVLDTRVGLGNVPTLRGGQPQRMTIAGVGGVPASASAVVVNLTATNATAATFVTAFPGGIATPPAASNLNVVPGQTVPNLVTVKIGKDGTIAFANHVGTVDVVGDVVGYYEQSYPDQSRLSTVSPTRVIDTRPGPGHLGFNTLGSGQTNSLVIPSAPAGATSVVLNVTVTNPTAAGFATVFPTAAAPNTPPTASNLNFVPGQTVANLAIAKLGVGGSVSFFNYFGSTDLVVDVVGWYTTTSTLKFTSVNPVRLLDSRQAGAPITRLAAANHRDLLVADGIVVPADAKAVLVNVTAVNPAAPGFLTVYPTAAPPNPPPLASNLNFTAGGIVPNLVVATLSADGKLSIYNGSTGGSVDVVIDLVGWYR